MKEGSKYFPLYAFLQEQAGVPLSLHLAEIEQLLGTSLPGSAHTRVGWWSNRSHGAVQAAAWMDAGYHVVAVDLSAETIHFARAQLTYTVVRQGDTVLWNGRMIKAMRQQLGLSQGELAKELGVRQQTISEWEKEAYAPSRATSKHLALVAERAGFAYETGSESP